MLDAVLTGAWSRYSELLVYAWPEYSVDSPRLWPRYSDQRRRNGPGIPSRMVQVFREETMVRHGVIHSVRCFRPKNTDAEWALRPKNTDG